MSVTPTTLDADWELFDNKKTASMALFNSDTENVTITLPPKTCEVLGPFDLTEEDLAGLDESLLHHETCILTVRALQFDTKAGRSMREGDRLIVDEVTWIVKNFKKLSWQTRYRCVCYKAA